LIETLLIVTQNKVLHIRRSNAHGFVLGFIKTVFAEIAHSAPRLQVVMK
jgi:hypothetical protein